jgi:hypothetical protein
MNLCGAQWLAYALPCRRFAAVLTDVHARLRVDVDRYSFIVSDLHRLLVAGLPAHCEKLWTLPASGDDLMKQAASIHNEKLPMLLPGIAISTGADGFVPMKQMIGEVQRHPLETIWRATVRGQQLEAPK